jgi:hypothetical protein
MEHHSYRLTRSIGELAAGEVLDVTARFGDWHAYAMELEPARSTPTRPRKVVVTESDAGFTEAEVLDETARFGDWHTYDLAFEPGATTADAESTTAPTRLTRERFERVTEPIDATA